ncbi:hypothetical protein B0H13DRAFT_2384954 [Mycena leptocephala]|nr:hypothetical protein B0H13DRAFT_2384954 [Mycena leptocephala]
MIEIGSPAVSPRCPPISHPCTLYATRPHGSYATPLLRFSVPTSASTPPLCQARSLAGPEERARIVDAICARGGEMIMHQCVPILSASSLRYVDHPPRYAKRRKIVACAVCHLPPPFLFPVQISMISPHSGRIVDLATNCYGYYVIQKALECKEEEDCLLIVSELGDPAPTLVGKHASHAWSKVRVVCILSNLYPSSSAPSFALVLPFDPLFPPRLLLLRYILTFHYHPLDRRSFHHHGALVDLTGAADLRVVPPPPLFIDANSSPSPSGNKSLNGK